ncbi:MAG: branched-chain amino acid transport system ATP-binding protein [Gaiellales bacterium]|jgi:branched-chain amino acid transport system ATP-binding protein|nr:branched-chain amino acid transport system ATP-binding protein [Gaiellales bacterium]
MTVGGPKPEQLVAEQIRVHFEGVKAVDGVDLTLERGEIMGLIGPNGAGKTTFMNAVSNFVPRTSGRVILAGRDVTSWPPHRLASAGLVRTFQDVATFPDLTVFENVELGALGAGLSRRKARARAWSLLEDLGLERMAAMPASALPHGEERRVGIARAVAVGPRFLLLDEPAAGLDDRESLQLAGTIAKLRDDVGCGVLLVEHDMRIIFRVCERIQVLDFGKPLALGEPGEIRTNPDVITAYLGVKGAKLAQEHHGA